MNDIGDKIRGGHLTLVIPVYEEQQCLAETLNKVIAFMDAAPQGTVDAVVVDDGSPEESKVAINRLIKARTDPRISLLQYPENQGKGFAVKTGVRAAEGDLILMSDADLSTPLEDWCRLYAAVQAGADIACGSRAVPGAHIGKPPPLSRRLLSRVFNLLVRLAGVRGIRDTQCGFKLFKADVAKRVFEQVRIRRFAFDVEMIALARDMGYQVVEIPVNWDYSGHSTVRLFSSGSCMVFDLLRLVVRRFFRNKRTQVSR